MHSRKVKAFLSATESKPKSALHIVDAVLSCMIILVRAVVGNSSFLKAVWAAA